VQFRYLAGWRGGLREESRRRGSGGVAELNADAAHPGYKQIGGDRPSESRDAVGVLVGNAMVADRPWVVFLVGLVDKQRVHDIRVAALSVRDNHYTGG
jgi:hypothetical protein